MWSMLPPRSRVAPGVGSESQASSCDCSLVSSSGVKGPLSLPSPFNSLHAELTDSDQHNIETWMCTQSADARMLIMRMIDAVSQMARAILSTGTVLASTGWQTAVTQAGYSRYKASTA